MMHCVLPLTPPPSPRAVRLLPYAVHAQLLDIVLTLAEIGDEIDKQYKLNRLF